MEIWNSLPISLINCETIATFKQEAQLSQRGHAMPRVVEYFG